MKDNPKIPDHIYMRKFYSKRNRDSFAKRFHKNRIVSIDEWIEQETKKTVYRIKYYRDTKRMRKRHNFPKSDNYQHYPQAFWNDI